MGVVRSRSYEGHLSILDRCLSSAGRLPRAGRKCPSNSGNRAADRHGRSYGPAYGHCHTDRAARASPPAYRDTDPDAHAYLGSYPDE